MAMRRQWGQRLGDLADILLKSHLQQKDQSYTYGLQAQNQKALSEQNAQQTILDQILKNPSMLSHFTQAYPGKQIGGMDPGVFAQTPDEATNDVGTNLAGVSDLAHLPTEQDVHQMLHKQPGFPGHSDTESRAPIEQLMAQVAAKTDALKSSVQPTMMSSVQPNADGTTTPVSKPVNPWNVPAEGIQTAPSPQQAGLNAGVQQVSELGTPGFTSAKVREHNLFTQGTQQADANAAGLKTGAETRSKLAAEWAPDIVAKKFDYESKLMQAQLMKSLNLDQMKDVNQMTNALVTLIPQAEEIRQLSAQINTRTPGQVIQRGMDTLGAGLETNPLAYKMANMQDSMALKMANSIGGNKGQVSENDKNAMKAFIPGVFDPQDVAEQKLADLAVLFEVLPQVMGQLDIAASPQVRINRALTMFKTYKAIKESQSGRPN